MGVEAYLLVSSLKAVLAQRLVRRLCPECAVPASATPVLMDSVRQAGLESFTKSDTAEGALRQPAGCPACRQTGFRGRTTISELLVMNDDVQDRLLAAGAERAIHQAAMAGGMTDMFRDGVIKVLAGETTLDEVLRVTRMTL
jgi:general secretion pathway protein E